VRVSVLAAAFVLFATTAEAREPLVFVADPKLGMETTVRTTDSVSRVVFRYEELLPDADVPRGVAVIGRGLKLVLFDEPLAEVTVAVAHEVGGHGSRARELNLKPTYLFYLPGVYRKLFAPADDTQAGAFTEYLTTDPVEGDRAVIGTMGGLEANYVHAWWINARIVRAGGDVHHDDLLVYAASRLTYFDSFFASPSDERQLNDIGSYVSELQDRSNLWRAEDRHRIYGRLRAAYLWNLFDPTLLWSVYGGVVAPVFQGKRETHMPLPEIDGTTLFLSPRFVLGPFGAENALDVFLARDGRLLDVYARVGTTGLGDSWGVGARALGIRAGDRTTLGGELDLWRQPEILLDERSAYARPYRLGMNAGAYADVRVAGLVGVTGKLAAKTPGFVMGQPIGGGLHGYLGVSVAWP